MTIKGTLDRERCVGAGQCVLAAPEVFGQDDGDGIVVLETEHPEARWETSTYEAAGLFPARAIVVDEQ
ncbi:ferredoxin [Streptomyces lydicus]|uniref:ferredoxin n=1 Tax=Streptomyces lydicus TaxID=47763 RepID=UPI0036D15D10